MHQRPDLPPALPSPGPRELAHKLNNLLTVVLAHAESSLASGDPDEMRQALTVVVETSHSMAEVVRSYALAAAARPGATSASTAASTPTSAPASAPTSAPERA